MKTTLIWTINDFPVYGMVSGLEYITIILYILYGKQ
jgi:hypothetical protein